MTDMGCCGCFGFSLVKSPEKVMKPSKATSKNNYEELLLNDDHEDEQGSQNDDETESRNIDEVDFRSPVKRSQEILMHRIQNGLICREFPVKETRSILRSEVSCIVSISCLTPSSESKLRVDYLVLSYSNVQ